MGKGSGNGNGISGNLATNGNQNTNPNENYRKPFNPNVVGELDKNLININSNKNAFDINALNSKRTENNINLNAVANAGRLRKGPVEEIKDERPAFNEKGENIYE
jgi:hypothetical protein